MKYNALYNPDKIKQRFSIRKLSVGAASVLLGTTLLFGAQTNQVKAAGTGSSNQTQTSNIIKADMPASTPEQGSNRAQTNLVGTKQDSNKSSDSNTSSGTIKTDDSKAETYNSDTSNLSQKQEEYPVVRHIIYYLNGEQVGHDDQGPVFKQSIIKDYKTGKPLGFTWNGVDKDVKHFEKWDQTAAIKDIQEKNPGAKNIKLDHISSNDESQADVQADLNGTSDLYYKKSKDRTINVYLASDSLQTPVKFVNVTRLSNGDLKQDTVDTMTLNGASGESITKSDLDSIQAKLKSLESQGYKVNRNPFSKDGSTDSMDQTGAYQTEPIVIYVNHDYQDKGQQTKTVTRTVKYVYSDGSPVPMTINGKQTNIATQSVTFTYTQTYDPVTKQTTNNWFTQDGKIVSKNVPAIKSPAIDGYTADKTEIPAETLTPESKDESFVVTYTKNGTPASSAAGNNTSSAASDSSSAANSASSSASSATSDTNSNSSSASSSSANQSSSETNNNSSAASDANSSAASSSATSESNQASSAASDANSSAASSSDANSSATSSAESSAANSSSASSAASEANSDAANNQLVETNIQFVDEATGKPVSGVGFDMIGEKGDKLNYNLAKDIAKLKDQGYTVDSSTDIPDSLSDQTITIKVKKADNSSTDENGQPTDTNNSGDSNTNNSNTDTKGEDSVDSNNQLVETNIQFVDEATGKPIPGVGFDMIGEKGDKLNYDVAKDIAKLNSEGYTVDSSTDIPDTLSDQTITIKVKKSNKSADTNKSDDSKSNTDSNKSTDKSNDSTKTDESKDNSKDSTKSTDDSKATDDSNKDNASKDSEGSSDSNDDKSANGSKDTNDSKGDSDSASDSNGSNDSSGNGASNGSSADSLPQTGNSMNLMELAVGALALGLGASVLAGDRKRKHN